MENEAYSDAAHSQVFFGGFLYNPADGPEVAFAVHRDRPWQSGLPLDPIPFEIVAVNEGNAFDADSYHVTIPTSGYYYMELVIGTLPERPANVEILLNGDPEDEDNLGTVLGQIEVVGTNHSHVASAGRSLITHLQMGDVLRIRGAGQTGIFSDYDKQTSWLGFLLYED
jgi:hypothetical protein